MRVAIVIVLMLSIAVNNIDARNPILRNYFRNVKKTIDYRCDILALNKTNNINMYNCFRTNKSNDCNHLDNYTDYYNVKSKCVSDYNSEIGNGFIITIIIWVLLSLMMY